MGLDGVKYGSFLCHGRREGKRADAGGRTEPESFGRSGKIPIRNGYQCVLRKGSGKASQRISVGKHGSDEERKTVGDRCASWKVCFRTERNLLEWFEERQRMVGGKFRG